jgi:branched-chain amino acid aminotransferase
MTAQPVMDPTELDQAPFGAVTAPHMVVSRTVAGGYADPAVAPLEDLRIHPFAHGLHYGSLCFEGMKAHRGIDDIVRLFRPGAHIERLRRSAALLHLPVPDTSLLAAAVERTVRANLDVVPASPGALYIRPALMGTDENIGAAATPSVSALMFVVASPVRDYFAGGERPLRVAIETTLPRTTPQFGEVKTGANYVMALGVIRRAAAEVGADQVLFAPAGDVQETGASNFLMIDDRSVVTKALDGSFLHGVTRDAILTLAGDLGYAVEERDVHVDELIDWARGGGEAALSGTAAVLSGVGTLVHDGREVTVGNGQLGPNTARLRSALLAIQRAEVADPYAWTVPVI